MSAPLVRADVQNGSEEVSRAPRFPPKEVEWALIWIEIPIPIFTPPPPCF